MAISTILQGDQYSIGMNISVNGTPITNSDVDEVEITIDGLSQKRTKTSGTVTYDTNRWWFSLTQQDTFSLKGKTEIEVRVLMKNGEVYGKIIEGINFQEGLSKEVLA